MTGVEEWDAGSKVALIHCYRDEPDIWNQSVVYRSDAERRHSLAEAWQRIQQRMSAMGYNFELPQLKKKMKQLRDQFSRENKMFEDHNSKWQFYEEMSFLNQNEPTSSMDYITKGEVSLQLRRSNDDMRSLNTPGSSLNGMEPLFEAKLCEEGGSLRGAEVKTEIPDSDIDNSLLSGQERSGAMVSSSGIVLSEIVMDELLRMVLVRKDTLLNDACDEKSKARAWKEVHDFVRAITKITPTVDELKEMFRRKQVYINDIVSQHNKANIFSVHGFARYIQSIVNKCLPEDKFSLRERELGTYMLGKSLSPNEWTPPAKKRSKAGESAEHANGALPSQECSSKTSKEVKTTHGPQMCSCVCNAGGECLKLTLQEMLKTQKSYFEMATEVQKEQLRVLSAMGAVLDRVAGKLPLSELINK